MFLKGLTHDFVQKFEISCMCGVLLNWPGYAVEQCLREKTSLSGL